MKVFLGVSANEVVERHLHKLVQVFVQVYIFRSSFFFFDKIYIYIYTFFFQVLGESPSYFGVPGLGGQGQVCAVPCDNLGGKKFEIGQGKGQDSD